MLPLKGYLMQDLDDSFGTWLREQLTSRCRAEIEFQSDADRQRTEQALRAADFVLRTIHIIAVPLAAATGATGDAAALQRARSYCTSLSAPLLLAQCAMLGTALALHDEAGVILTAVAPRFKPLWPLGLWHCVVLARSGHLAQAEATLDGPSCTGADPVAIRQHRELIDLLRGDAGRTR
jgi:hypothetical protein